MKYTVVYPFYDLEDKEKKTSYKVNQTYPRKGLEVSEERLVELQTNANKIGRPLIAAAPETPQKEEVKEAETDETVEVDEEEVKEAETDETVEVDEEEVKEVKPKAKKGASKDNGKGAKKN